MRCWDLFQVAVLIPFKSWLGRRIDRARGPPKGYVTTLKPLPDRRPALTPTSSNENLTANVSLFFARLSLDLRIMILEEAFGREVIHMNLLRFDPKQPVSSSYAASSRHATADGYKCPPGRKPVYQWSSSVCHRQYPIEFEGQHKTPFWRDPCHRRPRVGECCDEYSGQRPTKCWLWIMGFLLSCRQA